MTAEQAASVGDKLATLRRWARRGAIPKYDGDWTSAAIGQGRIGARMRERGQHFVEQDVVGQMESDLGDDSVDLGRMRVAIAFADLKGYARLTEIVIARALEDG